MRTASVPHCPACASSGPVAYSGLLDGLYASQGSWQLRRCARCGTLWLDPQPVAEDIHLAYRRYHTHGGDIDASTRRYAHRLMTLLRSAYVDERYGYSTTHVPAPVRKLLALSIRGWAGQRAEADVAVALTPAGGPVTMLDIGCGDGSFVAFAQSLGWDATGIDPDPAAVATARRRGIPADLGDLEAHGYPTGKFDLIVMNHVIEHVHDPRRLLQECRRILAVGGRVLITTPNAGSALHLRYREHWRGLEPPRHLRIYSVAGLASTVQNAGLTVGLLMTTARGAAYAVAGSRSLLRGAPPDGPVARARERAVAEILQAGLAIRLRDDPRAGQEILAVAAA
jgi:SAM-dependent methyltransferase